MTLSSLSALLAISVGQAAQRSFDWEPMPLPKLANKLAAALGEPVQVSKALAPCTLMVYAPSATVAEVQEKIAQATNGTWSKRGGVWYLEQTPEQIKADERTYQDQRRKAIQALLDYNKKKLQAQKPFTESHARKLYEEMRDFAKIYGPNDSDRVSNRVHELEMESPASRLNRRFLLALDIDTLASVQPGERRVFSTQPTPMQAPMPGEIAKEIAQYVEEQNLWARVTGEQPVTNENGDGLGLEFGANVSPVPGPIGTVLLTVDAYHDDTFSFRLDVFDRNGILVIEAESSPWDTLIETNMGAPGVEKSLAPQTELSSLPPESKALWGVLNVSSRKTDRWKEVTDAMMTLWRRPTQRDPLAYYVGGLIAKETAALKKSLVAVVPDDFMELLEERIIAEIQKYQRRVPPIEWMYDARIDEEPNWLILTPVNPLRLRKEYQDRSVLEMELAIGARLDPPSLEEEAELALKKGPTGEFGSFGPLLYTLRANPFHSGNQGSHLRVFAAMTQAGRTAALQKGGVPLSRLPKAAQDEVHRLAYMGEPYSIFMEGEDDPEPDEDVKDADPQKEAFWNGILREPTVLLPKGIPLNTTISFEVTTEYLVQTGPNPNGTFPRQGDLVNAAELGERAYMAANPNLFPWVANSTLNLNTSRMRLVVSRMIKITYNFQNGFRTVGYLQELRPVANSGFTLDTLPKEIKDTFVNAQKELEQRMKNRNPGQ
jgi:hypothetical protein